MRTGALRGADLVRLSLDEALSFHDAGEMLGREVAPRRSYPRIESARAAQRRRLLRARRKRPGDRAAQERNEFASFHPIELHHPRVSEH